MHATSHEPAISVVLPCLNEAAAISASVQAARLGIKRSRLPGEVVVVDNGSTDDSARLATAAGARVVHEPRPGYGSALLRGFSEARGRFVVMADADNTYDLAGLAALVEPLHNGYDMAIGNRMANVQPGAMPWLHRSGVSDADGGRGGRRVQRIACRRTFGAARRAR